MMQFDHANPVHTLKNWRSSIDLQVPALRQTLEHVPTIIIGCVIGVDIGTRLQAVPFRSILRVNCLISASARVIDTKFSIILGREYEPVGFWQGKLGLDPT